MKRLRALRGSYYGRRIAPVGAGAIYDVSGGYGPVLWAITGNTLLALLSLLLVRGPATRDAGS